MINSIYSKSLAVTAAMLVSSPSASSAAAGRRPYILYLLLSTAPSKSFSTTSIPPPTPDDIADLILRSNSAVASNSIFQWASTLPSFHHTPTTHLALVRSLLHFRRFEEAKSLILANPPSDDLLVTLIRALGRANRPQEAIKVLKMVRISTKPSLRILNSILDVLVEDNIDLARLFYRRKLASRGISGNAHTFGILMKGLCRANRIDEAFRLLKLAKRKGLGSNSVIYNTLIHALCKNGKVGRARSLLETMDNPSDVTFNIMISAYSAVSDTVKALVMVEKCLHFGYVPDIVAMTKVVDLMCYQGRVVEGVELLRKVCRKKGGNLSIDVVCYNTLISGFCKIGKMKVGRGIMKEMELNGIVLPNSQTYHILITASCDLSDVNCAMDLFREMEMMGITPDFDTFNVLIRELCVRGRLEDGLRLLQAMNEQMIGNSGSGGGNPERIEPHNSVIYGLFKSGRLNEAYGYLGRMKILFPRAVDRSFRVLGFCNKGQVLYAKMVYDEMLTQGDVPSILVYDCLVHSLCREDSFGYNGRGLIREAFDMMNAMISRGYQPVVSMFSALIGGFCRDGDVRSGYELLLEMGDRGSSPNSNIYGCVISGMLRRGEEEGDDSLISKACILLSDMVSTNGLIPCSSTWEAFVLSLCSTQKTKVVITFDSIIHSVENIYDQF